MPISRPLSRKAIVFRDRQDAGRQLAEQVASDPPQPPVIVFGLPRGGVPVAYEVAKRLDAPLDVFSVRKLGAPFNSELAVGAIATGGVAVYNDALLAQLGLDEEALEPIRRQEERELLRRERTYRRGSPPPDVRGRSAVLVDDGVATGATMRAAVEAMRKLDARAVIVAVPSASVDAIAELEQIADKVVVLSSPEPYMAVGAWYQHFPQLSDEDVVDLLSRARASAMER